MSDDTQSFSTAQPTISHRSPLDTHTRSERSDAPEAARETSQPSIDDPTGRPIRQTAQTYSTILEHTARLQILADELPPLVHSGQMLNHVQRIAEMELLSAIQPASQDTTGPPRNT